MAPKRSSTGFGLGALDALTERLWKNYRILSNAPMKFRPACNDIMSMLGAWHLVQDSVQKYPMPSADNGNLTHHVKSCNAELCEMEEFIFRYKFDRDNFNVDEIMAIQKKLVEQTNRVLSFYKILRSRMRDSIIEALSKIPFSIDYRDLPTIGTAEMGILRSELPQHGISEDLVDQEFFFIEDWLKKNFPEGATFVGQDKEVEAIEEELPDYEPGPSRESVPGRNEGLEKMMSSMAIGPSELAEEALPDYEAGPAGEADPGKLLVLEETARDLASGSSGVTSPKTDPPAYTLEDGSDEVINDGFSGRAQSPTRIRRQRQEDTKGCAENGSQVDRLTK